MTERKTVTLQTETIKAIENIAKQDKRTFSGMVNIILQNYTINLKKKTLKNGSSGKTI